MYCRRKPNKDSKVDETGIQVKTFFCALFFKWRGGVHDHVPRAERSNITDEIEYLEVCSPNVIGLPKIQNIDDCARFRKFSRISVPTVGNNS